MVDVKSLRCKEPGCPTQPSFGIEGGPATSCATHKVEGMVDVKSRRCAHTDCTNPGIFKKVGEPATNCDLRFCAKHKPKGMVSTKNRQCEAPDCTKRPRWAPEGAERNLVCGDHKGPDMINARKEKKQRT